MAPAVEKLVFSSMGDGLVRALGPDLTPALSEKLRARGFDVNKKFPPAWPLEQVTGWLELIAAELYPQLPREEALKSVGRRFIEGWQATLLGSAAAQVMKVMGPRRSLERIGRAFRTSDNFTEVSFEPLGATSALVVITGQKLPTYAQGVLEAGMAIVTRGTVTLQKVEGEVATYRLDWGL
jgi:uncharacterized protein (TIGR02265 family)